MDDRRFDALTKSLARGASRRSVLRGILGLGGAAVIGGVVVEGDGGVEAARRSTPTPKPPTCPGIQIWDPVSKTCICPPKSPAWVQCVPGGPTCCNENVPVGPGYSECCDNACCQYPFDCVAEEQCCLRLPDVGCVDDRGRCCTTLCEITSLGVDCCPADDFCPSGGGAENPDLCCHGNETCCGRNTNDNACVDLSVEGNCCDDGDCQDPCLVCHLDTHTCGPRCDESTEVCCTDQAGPGRCQKGTCCPAEPCPTTGQRCCVDEDGTAACVTTGECCEQDSDCGNDCLTCEKGACVPVENGLVCGVLSDDDDADDGGICCDGTCIIDAECCDADDCEDGEICCADEHICGPSCNGGVCCPGGFCDGSGNCCLPPNVGCNGGTCCDGFCDGSGNCCPAGNYGCNGGVCCSAECDRDGNCPPCTDDDACRDWEICCDGVCVSSEDYWHCSSDQSCCATEQACCDIDGCCDGVCYQGEGGPRDLCCDTLFCQDGALGDQCCEDPATEKCCGTAGCCAGQCTGAGGNECCTTGLHCPLDDGSSECCPNSDDYKCCGTQGCCTSSQCNEEADVCCSDGSFACGTTDGNVCCGTDTEKCCEGVCIDASECCEANGDICPTCEPQCDCTDPANDGLDCNGGIAGGGGVCACGWCVVPLDGCPCGCAGDEECVECDGAGGCDNINQLGICNSGAGYCSGPWCIDCLKEGVGGCSVDTMCCGELFCSDAGVCVICKGTNDSCVDSRDCCSGVCSGSLCQAQ